MAKSLEFNNIEQAGAVFPELPWQQDVDGNVSIFNKKTGLWHPVLPGQHIVAISDRYEVHDVPPKNAHPAVDA